MKTSKIAKLLGGSLIVFSAASLLAGCGGGGGNSGSLTTIRIKQDSGTGTKESPAWVEQCAQRFMEANRETSFGPGKKGVSITFKPEKINDKSYDTMASEGFNIYIDENNFDAYRNKNILMDISEVVNEYKDKIDPRALYRTQADLSSNTYYALPFYEWFPGISYDVDLFEEKNYYFADESVIGALEYSCSLNAEYKFKFVNSNEDLKSVGPDGVRGTTDDGLPSSIAEFITLCDLMATDGNSPLILCGSGTQYAWYMIDGIWSSLAGKDAMETIYCNYLENGTPLNVVTGFTNDDLFYAGSGIKKPVVETIKVTDENGYLCYSMVERYYALALFQYLFKHGDNNESFINTSDGYEALDAQNLFIKRTKGYGYGMLYDSSYWYHEDISEINKWNNQQLDGKKRHVAHMPLPTQFEGSVTSGNGKKNTLMDVGSTYIFVNKNTERTPDKAKACIEFLKFLYSDAELNNFTSITGLTVPKNSGFTYENADFYYQELMRYRNEANVIAYASTSPRFIKNFASFNIGYGSNLTNVKGNQEGYLTNFRNGYTAQSIFTDTTLASEAWNSMQK